MRHDCLSGQIDDRALSVVKAVRSYRAGTDPLHSAGLACSVGVALKLRGLSPPGSDPGRTKEAKPPRVDSRSAQAVLAWVQGVFAVKPKFGTTLPRFVQAELDRRQRGWYTLRVYTSLRVARYLVSLDNRRLASFQSIWCRRYYLLTRDPGSEYSGLTARFANHLGQPKVALKADAPNVLEHLQVWEYPAEPEIPMNYNAHEMYIVDPEFDWEDDFLAQLEANIPTRTD
jgi:hypothetical protein